MTSEDRTATIVITLKTDVAAFYQDIADNTIEEFKKAIVSGMIHFPNILHEIDDVIEVIVNGEVIVPFEYAHHEEEDCILIEKKNGEEVYVLKELI